MNFLKYNNHNFQRDLDKYLNKRNVINNKKIDKIVNEILFEVKNNGDEALIKYTKKYDNINLDIKNFKISKKIINSFKTSVDKKIFNSFIKAIKNVKKFHKLQLPKDYSLSEKGVNLKLRWKPIDSVGLYIPGGAATYPSSLIMNAVPAIVSGVKRIVCVTPPSENFDPYILGILNKLGIYEVYQIGGAQAIGALTFGTKTIKPVNKIFGPGNHFVTSAKKQVFGKVGIDLFAGPSEIVVVADKKNNPKWVASDLMAQAEHDINAQSILITTNKSFAKKVLKEIDYLSKKLSKKQIINQSLRKNGLIILVNEISISSKIINYIAPEHLHLQTDEKDKILAKISNAGSIFMGEYSTEAFGDYIVGTNHILPTSGSAKFSSGLSVLDFMKRSSIVKINKSGYNKLNKDVQQMAEIEDLTAHKLSVKIRQNK